MADSDSKRRKLEGHRTRIIKRCKQCGAVLAACTCIGWAPPSPAYAQGVRHLVSVEQQEPTALVADRPDKPHDEKPDYAVQQAGVGQVQVPPPIMGSALLRGTATLMAPPPSAPGALLQAAASLSAG